MFSISILHKAYSFKKSRHADTFAEHFNHSLDESGINLANSEWIPIHSLASYLAKCKPGRAESGSDGKKEELTPSVFLKISSIPEGVDKATLKKSFEVKPRYVNLNDGVVRFMTEDDWKLALKQKVFWVRIWGFIQFLEFWWWKFRKSKSTLQVEI